MKPTRLIPVPVLVLAAGAIAAVAIALTFGAAPLEVARIAVPPQLALKTAQLGFLATAAQAAPLASGAAYLPAHLAVVHAPAAEPLPAQF